MTNIKDLFYKIFPYLCLPLLILTNQLSAQNICGDRIQCLSYQECKTFEPTNEPYCADSCEEFECSQGTHCELVDVLCVREPCPPVARCLPDDPDDQCSLPPETGDCDGAFSRWYFNDATSKCERFLYGGCGGNSNNYQTEDECEEQCSPPVEICKLPEEVGPCDAAIPRWFFNSDTGTCERFIYGGCGGNQNNFELKSECERTCSEEVNTCELGKDPGPCRASIPRWFYNAETTKCERFIYGGCGGNSNNFETAAECSRACDSPLDTCEQPQVQGPCQAAINRWWFNSDSGQCERFTYGGCGGNGNNFPTQEECTGECGAPDVCSLPSETGPCQAVIPRWAFNAESGQCERFTYGGCGGNGNNFQTIEECSSACGVETCNQPQVTGPCQAVIPRWWHNPETDQCERFTYGGCGGNENNFQSLDQCRTECPPLVCDNPCEPHQVYKIHEPTNEGYCADTCNGFECEQGFECELVDVVCVRAPCPPIARCVNKCNNPIPGDYDRDGDVDQADRTVWLNNYGATVPIGVGADGNCDGRIDAADYSIWRDNLVVPSISRSRTRRRGSFTPSARRRSF